MEYVLSVAMIIASAWWESNQTCKYQKSNKMCCQSTENSNKTNWITAPADFFQHWYFFLVLHENIC